MKKNHEPVEILIAEDSPTQAEQLQLLLEEHKYKVTVAANGKVALELLARHRPALIISDVMMPELDGYGLCKAIKSDERLKHIPVMLVTTLSDPDDVIRGLECGADNFIRKPYEEKYLLSRINYLLMNVELRKNQRMQMALEINLGGNQHFITAERQQILDLLVSTYEQAVTINSEIKEREKELAQSNQVLQGLNHIAEGLNSAVSEKVVTETALRRALELPGIQAGWIFLRDGETGFRLAGACNLPPALAAPDAFDGDCICQQKLLSGGLDSVTNIIQCKRLAEAEGGTEGLCCHASVPLWLGTDRLLGVMNLAGAGNGLFSENELKVLHSVGNQVAVALERARLHENLERMVDERTLELRASEARLRAIIEAEPECVKIVDAEGRIVQMNAAGLAMIDADSLEQVRGHKVDDFVFPEQCKAYRAFAKEVLHGNPGKLEFEITSLKGRHLWLDTHAVPLPDSLDGRPQILAITRDVTERKQAEARLTLFRTLLDQSSDAIEVLDPVTLRFLDINETGCRVLGYSREELLSMSVSDIDPNIDTDAIKMAKAQLAQSGSARFETVHRRKDGSTIPVEVNATTIEIDKPYILSIVRDITQRKEDENRIARLNRIYAVLSGINTTIVRVREEEELIRGACRIAVEHGRFIFAWIGRYDADTRQVTPVAQAGRDDGYLARINLVAEGGIPGSCTLTMQALTSAAPAVCNDIARDARMAPWRDAASDRGYRSVAVFPLLLEGQPWGVFALYAPEPNVFDDQERKLLIEMSEDIGYALGNLRVEAQRRQAEDQLRKLSLAVEQSQNSIVITDLDANIEYVNEGFVKATGYSSEEVIGQNPRFLHSGKTPPEDYQDMWAHLTRGESWRGELVNRRKDGTEYTESIYISPVRDAENRISHYLAIKEDITERKQAEVELRNLNEELEQRVTLRTADLEQARHDAEQANIAKSAFLATMSHEIRTPMNGVIGMVDVLAQSSLSAHQTDLVNTIRDSAGALLGIIDDILDFSKIEAGRLELEHEPVSLGDIVEGLCNSLVPIAARKGVDLTLFVSPDIPERVLSDDVRLRQLLYNLVGNAIKFSSGQPGTRGRVSIRVDIAQAAPLRLTLSVADNGIGMSPETVRGLFTPFTQAEVSTTRRFGGTGLGLTICKRLADLMGGEIAVKSTLGAGSVFSVTLPFDIAAEQPIRSQPDISGLDCILVECPDLNADDLRAYLEHAGARVQQVADVTSAAEMAARVTQPVVIILGAKQGSTHCADLNRTLNARPLVITHGRRRRARVEGNDTVTLDGDALRRLALLRAVAVAAGRASPEIIHERIDESRLGDDEPPPTIAEARTRNRLILVAEDDEINQKVILQQLALLGHAAEIAGNGTEALRMWREGRYALLLTDLHMPEMDGYTLAEAIRREEAGSRRIPILALTANALRGEANRAYEAGMDEYLTKPVQLPALRAVLEKWLSPSQSSITPDTPDEAPAAYKSLSMDVAVLQGLVGNDSDIVRGFLVDYRSAVGQLAEEMRIALAAGDVRHIGAIAHRLKSSSRSVGALGLGDVCAELENACRTGNKDAIPTGMQLFKVTLAEVEVEIARLLAGNGNDHGK